MTEMEIFETVSAHLLKQDRCSMDSGGDCRYRQIDEKTGQVLKCGVGALINDEAYDQWIEGTAIRELVDHGGQWIAGCNDAKLHAFAKIMNLSNVPASHRIREMLIQLQTIHDLYEPREWKRKLEVLKAQIMDPNWCLPQSY